MRTQSLRQFHRKSFRILVNIEEPLGIEETKGTEETEQTILCSLCALLFILLDSSEVLQIVIALLGLGAAVVAGLAETWQQILQADEHLYGTGKRGRYWFTRQEKHAHACRQARVDARQAVLDHRAVLGRLAHRLGGVQKQARVRFPLA